MVGLPVKKGWLAALLALSLVLISFSEAGAHAALLRSDPPDNAILTESPREVKLWFNEVVSAEFSSVKVLDVVGQPVKLESLQRDAADPMLLILTLPPLDDGVYSINWRVLSEADGHFTQGLLVFGVGEGADVSSVASGELQNKVPLAEVLLRWINFSFLAILLGTIVVRFLLLERSADLPELMALAKARLLGLALLASVGALLAGLGLLVYQAISLMSSLPEGVTLLNVSGQLIGRSRWGALWLLRQLALLFGAIFLYLLVRNLTGPGAAKKVAAWGAGILAIGALVIQSLSGHAAALVPDTAVAVVMDALHLIAVAIWVGGMVALLVAFLPLLRHKGVSAPAVLRAGWGNFGLLSAPSVGVLAATGLYSTGRQITSLDALLTTLYGQALMVKIALVMAVALLGVLNAMLLHPRAAAPLRWLLRRPEGWTPLSLDRLPRLVLAEATLGLLVFLAVGVVTAAPPARGPEFTVVQEELLGSVAQEVDDMIINFSSKPNKPGQNVFTIRAISLRRPSPAEVLRVILRFTYQGQEMGTVTADATQIEEDLYRLGGAYLSLAGPWGVDVVVRRRGVEDVVAEFDWMVAPAGEPRDVLVSTRPWQPTLTASGGILLAAVLLGTALLGWRRNRSLNKADATIPTE